jgi:hypothetical protein
MMAAKISADKFKPNVNKLTELRIGLVMKYVIHCYLKMLADKRKYDFSQKGSVSQENFLRNGLVWDYLSKRPNKDYYKNHISDSPAVEIYFSPEENQVYQNNATLANDFIDISVKETRLSDMLSGETDDEIKFAIECKRIKAIGDCGEYVGDIQKFVQRPFTTYHLPFEGQIAFIESNKLNHAIVSDGINTNLKGCSTISTTKYLTELKLHDRFVGSYLSRHKRNYRKKQEFLIFHLLLDYSEII